MEYTRSPSVALSDVASATERRVLPQLNPLGECCLECGLLEEKEFENGHPLTYASAFEEASRRASARRNNPMSYQHLMNRPILSNDGFSCSYADWQVAGDPGNLMQELVSAKWPEWKPTEGSGVPKQFLPPPLKCCKCDVGTYTLTRREVDALIANMQAQGVLSPVSAPELSLPHEKKYFQQPPVTKSSSRRYLKKSFRDFNQEIRDAPPQNRRVRKGAKSHSIPLDDSTTDTEAAGERTTNAASKLKLERKPSLEVPKPPTSPPSPLRLDSEQFRLKLPVGPVAVENVPEDDDDQQATEQNCHTLIDNILAEKGLTSVTKLSDPKTAPNDSCGPEVHPHGENNKELKCTTVETKDRGTETRVVTPNEGSPPNSPKSTHTEKVEEDDEKNCITIMSRLSVKENNDNISFEKDAVADPKVYSRDLCDLNLKLVSELNEQLVQAQSTAKRLILSAKTDALYSEDTSVASTSFSLGKSSASSQSSKSISSQREPRREIARVVKKLVKNTRLGLGGLEILMKIQSMMEETTEIMQSD